MDDDTNMEDSTMVLDRKNQYCPNDYTIQGNLQSAISIKLPMAFFT